MRNRKKPFKYTVGKASDGGTLSGVAKLLYNDAEKWKPIYEANRDKINNPDIIENGTSLLIPEMQGK